MACIMGSQMLINIRLEGARMARGPTMPSNNLEMSELSSGGLQFGRLGPASRATDDDEEL